MNEFASLPDQPEGSVIDVLRGRGGVRLRWPRPSRLSGIILVLLGCATVLLLVASFFFSHIGPKDLVPWLFLPALVFGASLNLCYWLGRFGRSTIKLEHDQLVFYEPTRRRIIRFVGSLEWGHLIFDSGPYDIGEMAAREAKLDKQRRCRHYTVARGRGVSVEDRGSQLGISLGPGHSAIHFGQDLDDADRTWLVEVIRRWKDSPA